MPVILYSPDDPNPFALLTTGRYETAGLQHERQVASLEGLAILQRLELEWELWQARYAHLGAADTAARDAFLRQLQRQLRMVR
jgi:hypothetical protein